MSVPKVEYSKHITFIEEDFIALRETAKFIRNLEDLPLAATVSKEDTPQLEATPTHSDVVNYNLPESCRLNMSCVTGKQNRRDDNDTELTNNLLGDVTASRMFAGRHISIIALLQGEWETIMRYRRMYGKADGEMMEGCCDGLPGICNAECLSV